MPSKIYLILFFILQLSFYSLGQTVIWSENFEPAGNETYTSNTGNITGLPEWKYEKTYKGRLRLSAGSVFCHEGSNAATLDASQNKQNSSSNYLTAEIDLSAYTTSSDLELSFFFTHHAEESHSQDKVHIRGSDSDAWLQIYDWYANRPVAGVFEQVSGLDIDAALIAAGQVASSTFQVRFGQTGQKKSKNTTKWDGFTVDDIKITGSTPLPPADCYWKLDLSDSFGDGWNGGSIKVIVGGIPLDSWSLYQNESSNSFNIPITIGDDIELIYSEGGYSYENAYFLYDAQDNLVLSSGTEGTTPTNKNYSDADCTPPLPGCNWRLRLMDSKEDGWNGGKLKVFVGGALINTCTLSSGEGSKWFDIPIAIGDDVELVYYVGNYIYKYIGPYLYYKNFSYENSYFLYDAHDNLIHSSGDGNTVPVHNYPYPNADCDPHPAEPNIQDCLGAKSICGDSYSTTNSYEGTGNVAFEINGDNSCLKHGERNNAWYIFTVQEDGYLNFLIKPIDEDDDYDWSVFNLTNASCEDLYTIDTLEVSCNFSAEPNETGINGTSNYHHQGQNGTSFNDSIKVAKYDVYAINVSHYTADSQSGYEIDFNMASGVIVDVTPPKLDTIVDYPSCWENTITARFNELVETSSIIAEYFEVTGPGGPYSITNVEGTANTEYQREFELSLDAPLTSGGNYTLNFSGPVTDACENTIDSSFLEFTVGGITGSTTTDNVSCFGSHDGSITASASGGSGTYTYLWSDGLSTNQLTRSNLYPGIYMVTITDNSGSCFDVISSQVFVSNHSTAIGVWAGTKNTNWHDCENWGGGRIPNSSSLDVVIPSGCPNYPVFTSNTIFNNDLYQSITIQNEGSISINTGKLDIESIDLIIENGGDLNVDGKLTIKSDANLSVDGGTINSGGVFKNSGTTTITNGQINANSDFDNNSTINLSGGSISVNNEFKNNSIFNLSGGIIRVTDGFKNTGTFSMSNGTIDLSNNFINNNSFTSTGGEVIFSGPSIQEISGSNLSTFKNLTVDNSREVVLIKDIRVNGNLTLTNGKLNISDKEIDFGTTGTLVGETESNQVANYDGSGHPIRGLGTLKATRANPIGNVAGLGLNINPTSDLGMTTITRGLDTIHGTESFTGNSSISRYYIIESNNRASITTEVTMSYFGSDLVSHMNGTLIMFQEVKYGSGPTYLKPLSTINTESTNTAFAITVNNNLSNIKLTLGSSAIPLPVSLVDFTVNCEEEGVVLEWQTASEVNNAYFNIEKSEDGIHYKEIDEIEGHGNSNITLSYQSKDRLGTTEKTYYRLKQTDFDGTFKYIGTKVLNCDVKEIKSSSINLHPNPVKKGNPIYVTIDALHEEAEIKISIINILSQTAFEGFILTDYRGELIINSSISETLAKGHYIINGTYDNKSFQKKLIIN